jgi:replicative DNA helicase
MSKQYDFSDNVQRGILYLAKSDREFFVQTEHMISSEYFDTDVQSGIYIAIQEYFDKYRKLPSDALIIEALKEKNIEGETEADYKNEILRINGIQKESLKHKEAYLDLTEKFAKERAMKEAVIKGIEHLEQKNFEAIEDEIKNALKVGRHSDTGLRYQDDLESRYSRFYGLQAHEDRIPTGFPSIDEPLHGGMCKKELQIIVANSGCHRKGQGILMYDGSIKKVEDILPGDKLMGPDSTPRKVLKLYQGTQNMVEIQPLRGGKPFVVNEDHILHLKHNDKGNERFLTTTVKDHMKAPRNIKKQFKLYHVPVNFPNPAKLPVDPYMVGILLGDGTLVRRPGITSMDDEIVSYFRNYVHNVHGDLYISITKEDRTAPTYFATYKKGHKNLFVEHLKKAGIWGLKCENKFIPRLYKTASFNDRLLLLAGLIDTDGGLHSGCYEFVNKSKRLVEDISFVARSVGLKVSPIQEKRVPKICDTVYYRVHISGNIEIVPCWVKRKQAFKRRQIKDPLVSGFKMVDLKKEETYYGFELDGDHLYLLDDFTVTHNTGKSLFACRQALQCAIRNYNVLYISLEMSEDSIMARLDTMLTKMDYKSIRDDKATFIERIKQVSPHVRGELVVKQFPSLLTTPSKIRAFMEHIQNYKDIKFDVLIVDYLELLRPSVKDLPEYEAQQRIAQELRGLAVEYDVLAIVPTQSNRQGASARVITETELAGSFGKIREADFAFSINQDQQERTNGKARIYVMKSRNARSRYQFPVSINYKTLHIEEVEEDDEPELN